MICDICGFNNHVLNDCMKCLPWNYGLKLCGTPIKDQNFFYIDGLRGSMTQVDGRAEPGHEWEPTCT